MQRAFYRYTLRPAGESRRPGEVTLHPDHMDDLALWQAFRSGDEKALITIFERFTPSLYNYGYKIAAEPELVQDAIQELFIDIWQSRERLGDTDSIKYYLYKSLRRRLVKIKAKPDSLIFRRLSGKDYDTVMSPSPEFLMISEQASIEQTERLSAMLNILTKRQKEVMFLRYFDELNCDQIAMIMGLGKQAVYNLIHQSIQELKKAAGT